MKNAKRGDALREILKRIIMGFDEGTQGLMVNALVPTGEEGRNKLRKASESCK